MKANIGIDIDGVVCDIYSDAFKVLKEMYPSKIDHEVFGNSWEIEFGLTEQQVMNCFIECGRRGLLRTAKIYPGVKESLYRINRKYNIIFITWRNYIPNAREDTLYWLDSNKMPYEKLIISSNKCKAALKEGLCFFVDDNTEQCNRMSKTIIPTYLYSRPWNMDDETDALVKRVSGWKEIEGILSGEFHKRA